MYYCSRFGGAKFDEASSNTTDTTDKADNSPTLLPPVLPPPPRLANIGIGLASRHGLAGVRCFGRHAVSATCEQFESLVQLVGTSNGPLKCAAMVFINVAVNGSATLQDRLELRSTFSSLGMDAVLDKASARTHARTHAHTRAHTHTGQQAAILRSIHVALVGPFSSRVRGRRAFLPVHAAITSSSRSLSNCCDGSPWSFPFRVLPTPLTAPRINQPTNQPRRWLGLATPLWLLIRRRHCS